MVELSNSKKSTNIATMHSSFYKIALLLLVLLPACNFKGTNLDPTRSTDADLKEILPTAQAQTFQNLMSIGGRVTGTVIQHFEGIDAQPESYSQYLIDERTLDAFWRTGLYAGAMKDCQVMIEKADEANRYHYSGIAKILMAVNLGITTSFWGEVPFKRAFEGLENLQPIYDPQEEIYFSIQRLLTESIADLKRPPSQNPPQEDDLIFGGNALKWIATAKALQARYFLHLSKRRPDAAQKALQAIRSGAFQSLDEQPDFPFGSHANEANPLSKYGFERSDQLAMSDFLFQKMNATNDPRLPRYAVVVDGIPIIHHVDSTQLYWGQFDAPLPLISLTELKFIEAEVLLRLGQKEEGILIYREAVIASFEQLGIPSSEHQPFLDTYIHFDDIPSFKAQQKLLIGQKHIALFGQNPIEAWVDYRRTGAPDLTAPDGANPSFNPELVVPRRYLYPISERTSNELNLISAIHRQDGHLMDVDIWAFE